MECVAQSACRHLPASGDVWHDFHPRTPVHKPTEELAQNRSGSRVRSDGWIERTQGLKHTHPERMGSRWRRTAGLLFSCSPPQGEAFVVRLASPPEVKSRMVGQAQLHQSPCCLVVVLLLLQEAQRTLVEIDRLLMGVGDASLVARTQQVLGRLVRIFGPFPVVGQQAHLLLDLLGEQALQRLRHLPVKDPPLLLQQAVVGRLPRQLVLEDVLQLRDPRPLPDHLLVLERQQVFVQPALLVRNGCQHAVQEDAPDHRGHLQHPLRLLLQAVDARHQHPVQGVGDGNLGHLVGRRPAPGGLLLDDGTPIDQRTDDLLHVEGVALGAAQDALPERGGQFFDLQQIGHQCPTLGRREWIEHEVGVAFPVRVDCQFSEAPAAMLLQRAEDAHEQQGRSLGEGQQLPEEFDRSRVGPVQVFTDQDKRAFAGGALRQRLHRLEGIGFELRAVHVLEGSFEFRLQWQRH